MKKNNRKRAKRGTSAKGSASAEKYLTFYIDGQLYCIPTSQVVEIIRIQPMTFLPNLPDYVKGVINLRGRIVPVIDMRLRLHKEEREYSSRTSVVIVEQGENTVGLIVDGVKDVLDVTEDQIDETLQSRKAVGRRFVRGIVTLGREAALFLDLAEVLTHRGAESRRKEPREQAKGEERQLSSGQPVA